MDLAFAPFKVDVNPAPAKIFGQLRHWPRAATRTPLRAALPCLRRALAAGRARTTPHPATARTRHACSRESSRRPAPPPPSLARPERAAPPPAMATAASALVEPLPPPHPEPNQPRSRLHLAPKKLTDPFPAAHDRRSATATASHHRRPPELVEPPPQTIYPQTKYTNRCASTSFSFSPP